jgi:hypothetical protein
MRNNNFLAHTSKEKYEGTSFMTQSTQMRPKTSYITRNKANLQELMLDP